MCAVSVSYCHNESNVPQSNSADKSGEFPELYTAAEMAVKMKVSIKTIHRYVKAGMPSMVQCKQRRFIAVEVLEWLRGNTDV